MPKDEAPIDLKALVRTVRDRTKSCSELERLDVAVEYGELLKGVGDDLVGHFVEEARKAGASWAQIGERLGVTKQAAHQRHFRRPTRFFGRRRQSGRGPFERFGQSGKDVIVLAQHEARSFKHNYLGVEHLLLALTRERAGRAARLLHKAGVTRDGLRGQVRLVVGEGREAPGEPIPFTPRAKRALELAAGAAARSGGLVEPPHILLAVLQLRDGVGIEILDRLGVDRERLRQRTESALPG